MFEKVAVQLRADHSDRRFVGEDSDAGAGQKV
jgi:hypothetical protein